MTNKNPLKTPKEPVPGTVSHRVRATVDRLGLSEPQAAGYFGVPTYTVRKWLTGEREPAAVVERLLDVLGIVETFTPDMHATLIPAPVARIRKATKPKNPTQGDQS